MRCISRWRKVCGNVKIVAALFVVSVGSGCGSFHLYSSDSSPVVASVGDVELRESSLGDIYGGAIYPEDSMLQRRLVVNNWILSEVKRQAAEEQISAGALSKDLIEEMVEEYRRTLLIHSLEHNYLLSAVDTVVSKEQIEEYYKANKDVFLLAGPLVKAIVVRIPEGLRQNAKLENLFIKGDEEELTDFLNICAKNDYKVVDMRSDWVEFSAVLRHIPFAYTDFDAFLKKNKHYEITDAEYTYMLRVEAYLPSGAISPMERERTTIEKILRNLRRGDVIKHFNDSLLKSATERGLVVGDY
ncbi:MAG: hypothetical protein R3Y61_03240 [Rikenellaceae bacterium]